MRILIALGGNALLRRGEPMTMPNQIANIRRAASQIAQLADGNELVVAHGNGPQVGLLALQAAAAGAPSTAAPLDVLDAESEGMIGYLLEQELANVLPVQRQVATLLTRVEVDTDDPAFEHPTKPIGPVYNQAQAEDLAKRNGWTVALDGAGFRRVVASPHRRIRDASWRCSPLSGSSITTWSWSRQAGEVSQSRSHRTDEPALEWKP
jgi:carbamate kinase